MKLLKNTRKKVVTLAVASALGGVAMMSAPAHAMNVAQDGKGEVLLFPYYTVKNGFDTIFSVVNTSDRTTLFKIRFREAKNSREVRDFTVPLSPPALPDTLGVFHQVRHDICPTTGQPHLPDLSGPVVEQIRQSASMIAVAVCADHDVQLPYRWKMCGQNAADLVLLPATIHEHGI